MQEPAKRFIIGMKKLFLTSYSFKGADGSQNKDYKLVMVQSNEVPEGADHESVAYTKMHRWFPENHGPECELQSIIAHPTITGYAEDNIIRNQNKEAFAPVDKVLDASWFVSSDHPKESEINCGYSDDVLIDVDGKRKTLVNGWYDYDDKIWRSGDDRFEGERESEILWQYLPLAKYDK